MQGQTFGRRNAVQPRRENAPVRAAAPAERDVPADVRPIETVAPPVDEELRAWKESRRPQFPLRQFSLMASLCFAIASYALPESLNDTLQWPLYALAAASLYVGLSRRFGKSDPDRARGA